VNEFVDFGIESWQNLPYRFDYHASGILTAWLEFERLPYNYGDLVVVDLRHQYQLFGITFCLALVTLLSGCGKEPAKTTDTAQQAVDQAIKQLDIFRNSHAVNVWGAYQPKLENADQQKLQELKALSDQQLKDYDDVLNNLKTFADKPSDKKVDAKIGAFTKWLSATMLLYRGQLSLDLLRTNESREQGLKDKTLLVGLDIENLEGQLPLVKPENFDQAIAQSKAFVAQLQKVAALNDSQLKTLESVIDKLNDEVAKFTSDRNALVKKIGELTTKQPNVPGEQAVELQKQIAELETQRFAVLVEIESLTGGPMTLPENLSVMIGDRKLSEINGLKQLDDEKILLETRKAKIAQAIASQETYIKNLQQQVGVTSQRGQELSRQIDNLKAALKENIQQMDQVAASRTRLLEKAKSDLSSAARYAQQADSDLKQYVSAVNDAASQVTSGEDNFLKEAKNIESLQFSIGEVRSAALLLTARLKASQINDLNSVTPVLERSAKFVDLPESLNARVKASKDDIKSAQEELSSSINGMVSLYETLYRNASRSELKSTIGMHYLLALYQASTFNPQGAAKYQAKAKEILGEIAPASATDDPTLKSAQELRQLLGL
jgi:hypothetical protein